MITPKQIAAIIAIIIGLLVIIGMTFSSITTIILVGLGIMVLGIAILIP